MNNPLVSVLIPCYNAGKYVGGTLESVFRQTWQNIEVIVVDDGSKDNSADVVRSFRDSRLKLIEQTNKGSTTTRNVCLSQVTGDFVQYLDADDLLAPDKIELQMKRLVNAPRSIASAEWARFYTSPDEATFVPEPVWRDLDPLNWLVESRADGLGMMQPGIWLIPTSVVQAAGPWRTDLSLNDDAEYFTRVLLAADRVLFCAGARCYYRSGLPGSLSGRKSSAAWSSQVRVLELCEGYVIERENSDRARRGFALSWQHLAHACYPYDRRTAEYALKRAKALHSVTIKPDGGPTFHLLSRLLGWRLARKLQVASGRP